MSEIPLRRSARITEKALAPPRTIPDPVSAPRRTKKPVPVMHGPWLPPPTLSAEKREWFIAQVALLRENLHSPSFMAILDGMWEAAKKEPSLMWDVMTISDIKFAVIHDEFDQAARFITLFEQSLAPRA